MLFCSQCGARLEDDARFCSHCGAQVTVSSVPAETTNYTVTVPQTGSTAAAYNTAAGTTYTAGSASAIYELYLVGLGSCDRGTCNDLLEDLLGYTDLQAEHIINSMPVLIACQLTYEQAQVLAQAMAEYGISVSVTDGVNSVDMQSTKSSVFSSSGALIGAAAAVLATLGAVNRLSSFNTYKKPGLLSRLFHTIFAPKRPVHVRRSVHPAPAPRYTAPRHYAPAPGPVYRKPMPASRPAPGSAMRPAGAHRPSVQSARPQTPSRNIPKPGGHTGHGGRSGGPGRGIK